MATTTCPKCRYVRLSTDIAPAWQCPQCKVAYSKALDAPYVPPLRAERSVPKRRTGIGLRGILMVCALVYGSYLGWTHPWRHDVRPIAINEANAQQPEVVLYATSWCPYCAKTRDYFRMHHIRYSEYDIDHDRDAHKRYRRLRGNGVPVVVIGDEVLHGYQPDAMTGLLEPWLR